MKPDNITGNNKISRANTNTGLSKFMNLKDDDVESIKRLTSVFVHDVRTPLLCIKMGGSVIDKYLPRLVEAYEVALKHGLIESFANGGSLDRLEGVVKSIDESANEVNSQVDEYWNNMIGIIDKADTFGKKNLNENQYLQSTTTHVSAAASIMTVSGALTLLPSLTVSSIT